MLEKSRSGLPFHRAGGIAVGVVLGAALLAPASQAQSWQDALKKSDDVEAARAAGEQAKEAAGSETTSDRLKGAASKGVGVAADETAQGADLKSAGKKGGSAALDAAVGSP